MSFSRLEQKFQHPPNQQFLNSRLALLYSILNTYIQIEKDDTIQENDITIEYNETA